MTDEHVPSEPVADEASPDVPERVERVGVLRVGEIRLGVEARFCSGLVDVSRPTPLPRSPTFVIGLLLRRGSIVPLLDTGELLGIERNGPFTAGLVVSSGGGTGVLATDEMVAFEPLDLGKAVAVDESVSPRLRAFGEGILTGREVRIVMLDIPSLFMALRSPNDAGSWIST